MGDTMLIGVLRMPMDNPDPLQLMQFVSRARQAADRIEADAKEIERLALDRDEQAELRAQHFDRANKLSIENKALRKHIESLIVAQEEEAVFGPHNEIPSLNAEIERLKEEVLMYRQHKAKLMGKLCLLRLDAKRLREALQKFLDNSSVQTNHPDECEFAEAALAKKESSHD